MNVSNLAPSNAYRSRRNYSRGLCAFGGVALAFGLLTNHAAAATTYTWANKAGGTDWNTAGDWTPTTAYPGSTGTTDTAYFSTAESVNPNLSSSVTIATLDFATAGSGYNLTSNSSSVTLSLSSTSSTADQDAIYANQSGTNTISAPLVFTATSNTQYVVQQNKAGTLTLASTLKASGTTIQFGATATGTIIVQANNGSPGATGSLTANVKLNGGSVVVGSSGTLGSGSITFNTTTNLASSDSNSRTFANSLGTFGGTTPFYVLGKDPNAASAVTANEGNGDLIFSNTTTTPSLGSANARRFVVYNNTTFAANFTGGAIGTANTTGGIIKTGTGTLTLSGNNTFEGPVTVQGSIGYTPPNSSTSVTSPANAGTLVLSGSNTFTGITTIQSGVLSAAADNALQSTSSILVNNGGTLLLANATANSAPTNNRVNDAAPITLGTAGTTPTSGTIQKGSGVSEGTSSSAGLGALTLAGTAGGTIDYTSTAGTLTFASLTTNGGTLTINNYVNDGTDHLIFGADQTGNLSNITFTGFGGAMETEIGASSFYEITPVPEPATWAAGLASVGLVGFRLRRRVRQIFRLA